MSKEKTSFVYVTYIRSTPEKVFEAITKPEIARRYWGHENVSDWKPGSAWEHVRANEQRTVELVGKVVESLPPTRLVITWANASQGADPASYSRVSFDIAAYEEMVRLTVTHDELEAGSGMAKGIQQGWPIVLSSLKSLLETGQGIDVFAKPRSAQAAGGWFEGKSGPLGRESLSRKRVLNPCENIVRDSPGRIAGCFAGHENDPANFQRTRACHADCRIAGGLCRQSGAGMRLAVAD